MNYKTVKRPERRLETSFLPSLKLQTYGSDNLYPQRMVELIDNSPTGGTCCDRLQTFIEGNGFADADFAEYVCNRAGDTNDDLNRLIAYDIAHHNGFALHVNYNLAGKIIEIRHIPFMNCRLAEEDDNGHVPFIKVHPDWSGRKSRNGKLVAVKKETVRDIYVFNPRKEVVLAQMIADGGIENYRGQVLWVSLDGNMTYPKPIYDKVVSNLSTDAGLDNVKYRNVRNNFLLAGMLLHKKGASLIDEEGNEVEPEDDDDSFSQSLDIFQGDTNACSIMDITYTQDEDIPKFVSVEGANFDRKFVTTEASVTERIYSAFGQEPWYCIRVGKTGFSGDVLKEAYEYYNSYVERYRRAVSRAFKKIYHYWYEDVSETQDFTVTPLVYQYNYANGSLLEAEQRAAEGNNAPQIRR